MDARQGRSLRAHLRPPGVQSRRPVQVLGRADGRGLGRRTRAWSRRSYGRGRAAASRSGTEPRAVAAARRRRRPRRAVAASGGKTDHARARPWCWPAAASRPTPNGARAISGPAGISPRCAARASTPATASAWRWISARCPTATGPAATPSDGTATRPNSAISRSATGSRSTATRSASWSTRGAERFVDEGADFRNYTYAKYGRAILEQPGQFAWQVFDRKVTHLLRDEYRIKRVTKVVADTLEELAEKLEDVDPRGVPGRDPRLQRRGARRRPVQSQRQGRPLHARPATVPRATGPTRSTRRRSRPTRSPAASPSLSAACASPTTPA